MNGNFLSTLLLTLPATLLPALGALASEHAGVLNIAMEGFVLLGAFVASASLMAGASLPLALVLAAGSCLLGGGLLVLFRTRLKADLFMAGLALNLLIPGGISLASALLYGQRRILSFGELGSAAASGPFFLTTTLVLAILYEFFLRKTRPGLRSLAVGAWPEMLAARGIAVGHYKDASLLASAVAGGLGGAALALALGSWVPGMSAGKGWIALVLVYAGNKSPAGVVLAGLAYGACELAALRYQHLFPLPLLSQILPALLLLACLVVLRLVQRLRQAS